MKENKEPLADKLVLIVDDEEDIRSMLEIEFRFTKAKTLTAKNGREAMTILKNNPVDLIVSDIRMPGGDGISFIKALKSEMKNAPPLIFITGFSDLSLSDAYDLGAEGVFHKPFELDSLVSAARRSLASFEEKWLRSAHQPTQFEIKMNLSELEKEIQEGRFHVGRGGFYLKTVSKEPLHSKRVHFEIVFNGPNPLCLSGQGLVRWARSQDVDTLPAGIGLEIEKLEGGSYQTLTSLINRLQPISYIPHGSKKAA